MFAEFLRIFDDVWGQNGLQTASEVRSDLRFEISDLNHLHIHGHIAFMYWTHFQGLLVASEATTASKRPQRADLTTDLEFVAQTSYGTMFSWAGLAFFWTLIRKKKKEEIIRLH